MLRPVGEVCPYRAFFIYWEVIYCMEFVSLRNLQRGRPEVWNTLAQENGCVVLINKGQPAYLLIDLAGKNVISLINWLDNYLGSDGAPPGTGPEHTPAAGMAR